MSTCADCEYFQASTGEPNIGYCHRYPPPWASPLFAPTGWCAEYKKSTKPVVVVASTEPAPEKPVE